MREIYLDYAAATPLDPRVKAAMEPYFGDEFGNPSSVHEKGRKAREAVEQSRAAIVKILGCTPGEIVFTSGATEADALAILGIAKSSAFSVQRSANSTPNSRGRLLTTKIEHDAVLNTFRALEKEGFEAAYLSVSPDGLVNPAEVAKALRPDTLLVSIGYANSEIGVIQPIAEIGKIVKKFSSHHQPPTTNHQLVFHTDASQAAGFLDLNIQKLGVDLMTLNSSKIYGPKGVGCLYVKSGIELRPIIHGGGQERGLRSGTENMPGVVGFAKALEIAESGRAQENSRLVQLRDYLIGRILKEIPHVVLNGHSTQRLSNNVNISIPGLDGETAVVYLSERGVYASTGSACTALSLEPSHVIAALGKPEEYTRGSLRFTLGRQTTGEDIDYVVKQLKEVVWVLEPTMEVESQ